MEKHELKAINKMYKAMEKVAIACDNLGDCDMCICKPICTPEFRQLMNEVVEEDE